jgi:hypothetical protein
MLVRKQKCFLCSENKATASRQQGAMFAILLMTQLDAAEGYTSIYGDGSSQALAGIKIPSVPWGRCDTLGTCPHTLEKCSYTHTHTHTLLGNMPTRTETHTHLVKVLSLSHTHTHSHATDHGNTFTPNASWYHGTSRACALAHAHTPAARAAHDEGQR